MTFDGLTTFAPDKEAKPGLELTSISRVRMFHARQSRFSLAVGDETERSMVRVRRESSTRTPRLLPGRAGESVKRSGISSLHPHPGRPSHAHVACAVCPQLLSCPSTARYVPVRSAAPPARTGLSQAPACPATAHMHGVVSCTHAAVQFLTSSFTSHPFQNLKRYPQENSNRTTSH